MKAKTPEQPVLIQEQCALDAARVAANKNVSEKYRRLAITRLEVIARDYSDLEQRRAIGNLYQCLHNNEMQLYWGQICNIFLRLGIKAPVPRIVVILPEISRNGLDSASRILLLAGVPKPCTELLGDQIETLLNRQQDPSEGKIHPSVIARLQRAQNKVIQA